MITMGMLARRLGAIVVVLLGVAPAAAEDVLDGTYIGVDDAAGATIEIEPEGNGFEGKFEDASGSTQRFEAERLGDLAETFLDMDNRVVMMRMAPLPFGAQVSLVPLDAQGNLLPDAGRVVTFVREGLDLPERSPDFVQEPTDPNRRITAKSFVASYEFWSPDGVRVGYLALAPRFRTVMQLFPAVQLDIIWKLCLAPEANDALSMALRGQDVNCDEVVGGVAEAQRSGRFDDFKEDVAEEREILFVQVQCADGYLISKSECDEAALQVSKAAVSLETAGTVLARYR